TAESTARSTNDPEARAATLRVLARVLAQIGEFDGAESTARSIPDPQARAAALKSLDRPRAQAGHVERPRSTEPDGRAKALSEAARAGEADPAVRTAQSMSDPHERARALGGIVSALVESGNADGAENA